MSTTVDEDMDIGFSVEALAGRLFESGVAAFELVTCRLGAALGLYAALADAPDRERGLTPGELAAAAGIAPRYAREWLEQQAAAGFVTVDDVSLPADERRFALPVGSEAVLIDPESPAYLVPIAEFLESVGKIMPALLDAYRTGGGVPYADYEVHDAQAAFNRPAFTGSLTQEWLPQIPDVEQRLRNGARVAELGCGEGWAAIALARAYPGVTVDGFDLDIASIEAARGHAAAAGVADRARFVVADVTDPSFAGDGGYNVVFAFEMLHDLSQPIEALRNAARLVSGSGDGAVIVMDERAGDSFSAPADPIERFLYCASVLHCLPVGMAEQPSAGTGTVMRAGTLRDYAAAAGLSTVEILPIEHDIFRFYRLGA